jgi:hypothetical protein
LEGANEDGVEMAPSSMFGAKPRLNFFYFFFLADFSIALKFELELGFELKFS